MADNELSLRPISDLLNENFYIPAYQRGYRWTKRQVVELLDDVYEFCGRRKDSDDDFYCLQPIVVRTRGDQWELVDGQQRLTTILLVLNFFNLRFSEDFRKKLYSIEYETRPGSQEYLANVVEGKKDENIDFHHMFESLSQIKEWFSDKVNKVNDIESAFLNDVKIIWYEVNETIDPIDIFTRLNIGKIPLTNAELVKALFLRSSNFAGEPEKALHLNQLKIAQEWDSIEKNLQNDEFWYFISNDEIESNRIEFVLKLAAKEISDDNVPSRDPFFTFLTFNRRFLEEDCHADREWLFVKRYFMVLHEWFTDRVLFHLVGYLVCQQESISEMMELSKVCETRRAFRAALVSRVFAKALPMLADLSDYENVSDLEVPVIEQLEQFTYESGRSKLLPILLLFNVASLLENSKTNSRFQFNRFKSEEWDIEHIRSVASEIPRSKEKQKSWLVNVVEYISEVDENPSDDSTEENSIREDSLSLLKEKTFNSIGFEALYNRVVELYDPNGDDEIDQTIGNLTLLDRSTNRSYQNAVFPIKRTRIISLDKAATFVPLCTKNAFLKYYSRRIDKMMFWGGRDSQDHQKAMADVLVRFIENKGEVL